MIRGEKNLNIELPYDISLIAPPEHLVFFDIETTGLSPANSFIYLIGTLHFENGSWILRQYFAEDLSDEERLIEMFFSLIAEKRKNGRVFLISYNGDTFDIPFISKCAARYMLPYDLTGTLSLDLFKKARKLKTLLELENCRLKTVERLCGIEREDKYGGGELIYVYEEYLRLRKLDPSDMECTEQNRALCDRLLYTLLLHNAEDISVMPNVMQIMAYDYLLDGDFDILTVSEPEHNGKKLLDIECELKFPLPVCLCREDRSISISAEQNRLEAVITLFEGELKLFFDDYRNYYYLPGEDMAIHRSVGEFVAPSARVKATRANCYQRKRGLFLPEKDDIYRPVFYPDHLKREKYVLYGSSLTDDREKLKNYILSYVRAAAGLPSIANKHGF